MQRWNRLAIHTATTDRIRAAGGLLYSQSLLSVCQPRAHVSRTPWNPNSPNALADSEAPKHKRHNPVADSSARTGRRVRRSPSLSLCFTYFPCSSGSTLTSCGRHCAAVIEERLLQLNENPGFMFCAHLPAALTQLVYIHGEEGDFSFQRPVKPRGI